MKSCNNQHCERQTVKDYCSVACRNAERDRVDSEKLVFGESYTVL